MKRLIGTLFAGHRIPLPPAYMEHIGLDPSLALGDVWNGAFAYTSPVLPPNLIRVMAGRGDGWDHVSVSLEHRCPTWEEMEWVKRMFFEDNEIAYQLHVTPKAHINCHPFTLHLWRPLKEKIPLPPSYMV